MQKIPWSPVQGGSRHDTAMRERRPPHVTIAGRRTHLRFFRYCSTNRSTAAVLVRLMTRGRGAGRGGPPHATPGVQPESPITDCLLSHITCPTMPCVRIKRNACNGPVLWVHMRGPVNFLMRPLSSSTVSSPEARSAPWGGGGPGGPANSCTTVAARRQRRKNAELHGVFLHCSIHHHHLVPVHARLGQGTAPAHHSQPGDSAWILPSPAGAPAPGTAHCHRRPDTGGGGGGGYGGHVMQASEPTPRMLAFQSTASRRGPDWPRPTPAASLPPACAVTAIPKIRILCQIISSVHPRHWLAF